MSDDRYHGLPIIPSPNHEHGRAGRHQGDEPTIWRIDFTRIGRHLNVAALEVPTCDRQELIARIRRYAQPKLASRTIEVWADEIAGVGYIQVGDRPAGAFTITRRSGA